MTTAPTTYTPEEIEANAQDLAPVVHGLLADLMGRALAFAEIIDAINSPDSLAIIRRAVEITEDKADGYVMPILDHGIALVDLINGVEAQLQADAEAEEQA